MRDMGVIEFPKKSGGDNETQWRALGNGQGKAIDALAAIARKYPDIELTTDEILEAAAWKPKALFHGNLNTWKLSVTRRINSGEAG